MKNFISSLFSSNGKVSSTRFVTLVTCLTILIVYVGQNLMAIHIGQGYIDFPTNSVTVLLIVLGAKVGQHVSENRLPKQQEENKP